MVARRAPVPLIQVRALLPGPGDAAGRLAAACLLRRPGARERLEAAGATAEVASRPDGLLLSACAEPGSAQGVVDLLLELLRPADPPPGEVVSSESARLASVDAMLSGDPGETTRRAALAAAFGAESPYAEPLAGGAAVDGEAVRAWHSAATAPVVVVCGDLRTDADWGEECVPLRQADEVELRPLPDAPRWLARQRPGAAQTTLRAVAALPRIGTPGRAAAEVLQRLLGGGKGSRLVHELRERRGFGYHPGTSIVDLAQASYLLLEVDVATGVTAQAVAVVDDVLQSLAQDPPRDAELELGRRSVVGDLGRAMDAQGSLAELLLACSTAGAPPSAVTDLASCVAGVTSGDVADAATGLLRRMHGAALADLDALQGQPLPETWGVVD